MQRVGGGRIVAVIPMSRFALATFSSIVIVTPMFVSSRPISRPQIGAGILSASALCIALLALRANLLLRLLP